MGKGCRGEVLLVSAILTGLIAMPAFPSLTKETAAAKEDLITVLNPQGRPSSIPLVPLVPRLDSLVGKTIYLVDVRFMNGDVFLKELQKLLAEKYPQLRTEFRQKKGQYTEDDPELWSEIKRKGHGMIMAIGH